MTDDFELWLGHIRDGESGERLFRHQVLKSANLAGGQRRTGSAKRQFHGSRIGRGAGVGRVLASRPAAGAYARRVIVKARIVKLGPKGMRGAIAHLRYLQRDGTTRDGERGQIYSAEQDITDSKAFLERGAGDRHQFRFIVAPEDGAEYDDLKSLVRRWMDRVAQDLGSRLDWVAVDHFNTGHPHAHVMLRGKDDRGKDLILAREYMTHGLRERLGEVVNLDLGPRSELEIFRAQQREVEQERFTGIDRRLMAAANHEGLVSPHHHNPVEQGFRLTRLRRLEEMALARRDGDRWRLDAQLEPKLRRMGELGDIIKTMHRAMREHSRLPSDYAIYDPERATEPLVGQVVVRGLSDEHRDRQYLIVDATDGQAHYVEIGASHDLDLSLTGSIVRIAARPIDVREVDRTVAAVAAANDGRYSEDLHLRHDPSARPEFARAHARRLEAIRREMNSPERAPDGSWRIPDTHLDDVATYERRMRVREPVTIQQVSSMPLVQLPVYDGATWLDRQLAGDEPVAPGRGFAADVRDALDRRLQWLMEQDLASEEGRLRSNFVAALQQRELRRVATQMSAELGLDYVETRRGDTIAGKYARAVQIGDRKFAVIEKSKEFTLVPWRPVLERELGKQVSGIMREQSISWTFGRDRGISIS